MRIIKKYSNRRLYDTDDSQYITLQDIRKLVIQNIHFQVIDAKTEKDITTGILLQVILEEEHFKDPLFTAEVLKHMIRFYGNPLQKIFSSYLEQFVRAVNKDFLKTSWDALSQLTEQQMAFWQKSWSAWKPDKPR